MLEVTTEKQNGHLVLRVQGRMDNKTSSEFAEKVERFVGAGEKLIVVDMSGLDYISSAGLRALLNAGMHLRSVEGGLSICCLTGMVKDVLEVAGFGQMFPVHETLGEALSG
ncbi:anti-anti-sigma factor [Oceanidesulfovibrio indonesiensis]|uniref:Anti-sigma factor antagonist n=1 Tax=Oceanidesulfovibrio indonesiensis TaxID=54767 RepID=A0A7M3MF39_9BACT|nr:STAS domain-containing protein [Oceanidesulfovibrio indonesiensis]TVM17629.1 anti-anti-sigma factor [Oceanidesulfovibrio indonesiensis]